MSVWIEVRAGVLTSGCLGADPRGLHRTHDLHRPADAAGHARCGIAPHGARSPRDAHIATRKTIYQERIEGPFGTAAGAAVVY